MFLHFLLKNLTIFIRSGTTVIIIVPTNVTVFSILTSGLFFLSTIHSVWSHWQWLFILCLFVFCGHVSPCQRTFHRYLPRSRYRDLYTKYGEGVTGNRLRGIYTGTYFTSSRVLCPKGLVTLWVVPRSTNWISSLIRTVWLTFSPDSLITTST